MGKVNGCSGRVVIWANVDALEHSKTRQLQVPSSFKALSANLLTRAPEAPGRIPASASAVSAAAHVFHCNLLAPAPLRRALRRSPCCCQQDLLLTTAVPASASFVDTLPQGGIRELGLNTSKRPAGIFASVALSAAAVALQ